jgi:hypothetical protein
MAENPGRAQIENTAQGFRYFASLKTHGVTSLYRDLADQISRDPDLLEIAAHTRPGQPVANMLFGAVHYLLLSGVSHRLARFYRSLTPAPLDGDAFTDFRSFCLEYAQPIQEILATRLTQTNEVNRSILLLPVFEWITRRNTGSPIAMIELGSSAGFNLRWDQYHYRYGRNLTTGQESSPLKLETRLRGKLIPPIPTNQFPEIAARVGIDLNPLDLQNPSDLLWLKALVWPENTRRMKMLEQAAAIARTYPVPIIQGDILKTLPAVFEDLPPGSIPVVFHSFVFYQLAQTDRQAVVHLLRQFSEKSLIYRISLEWYEDDAPVIELDFFEQGEQHQTLLARCNPHGEWLEWLEKT